MIEQIAKTDFYEVSVDKAKNRWYVVIKGTWERTTQVANYLADCSKGLSQMTRGFTAMGDLSQAGPPSPEVASLHEGLQKRIVALGASKVAEVVPPAALATASFDKVAAQSQMARKQFTSRADAEAWLDQK